MIKIIPFLQNAGHVLGALAVLALVFGLGTDSSTPYNEELEEDMVEQDHLEFFEITPVPTIAPKITAAPTITVERPSSTPTLKPSPSKPAATVTPTAIPSLVPTPTSKPKTTYSLPAHNVLATVFWVGEGATGANAFISNVQSAWDAHWSTSFGGIDNPNNRCGYKPCGFTPKENPFYFALPYSDLDNKGNRKASAQTIPWFEANKNKKSVVKNSWIKVTLNGVSCYAQWEDVGPLKTDDFAYVFGTEQPKNTFSAKAGLDISPAVRDCLSMKSNEMVEWVFVAPSEVPSGPWKEIVTTSDVSW